MTPKPKAIDFTDDAVLMNNHKRIPVDSEEKFEAVRNVCIGIFAETGRAWIVETDKGPDYDNDQQLTQRVLNGLRPMQIFAACKEDRIKKYDEDPDGVPKVPVEDDGRQTGRPE